jgi:hypothetical protein
MQRTDDTKPRPQEKQAYTAPEIRELGQLKELTRGGAVAQTGEGPGFSL